MSKKYPTLYATDNHDNIRIWFMEQDGARYRSISGLQDSESRVSSGWTTATVKNAGKSNATSESEQATSEILSKYERKKKTGYNEDVRKAKTGPAYVEPMLALSLKKRLKKLIFPGMLDRKYNGGRVVTTDEGPKSRKGEDWLTIPHIYESVSPLFTKYPDLVLDGEGYNHEYRYKLNDLMSILRKQEKSITPEVLEQSKQMVRYYVYDGYGFEGITEETGCRERREALKKLLKGYEYVVVADYTMVSTLEEAYKVYQSYVDDGYEGAMFRHTNSPYSHTRSADLLKMKPEDDDEAIIVDITDATGNWIGAATNVTLKWKDKEFDGVFTRDYATREKIYRERKEWIGKKVTFLYMGLTGLGTPNYARVDPWNCFK